MEYRAALAFLYGLTRFGLRLGLDVPRRLAEAVGNPQAALRFIHVTGTNGKGSTCAFLESVYRHAGLRVGLYTSPHLMSFRERIQVNREPIPESDVGRLATQTKACLGRFKAEEHPTFFEFVTVMALQWFREKKCDLVIWETGIGGRLDATNIVTPLASIITNVGWDHMQVLGETLSAIAREKSGIIKPGVPVLTAAREPEALEVIAQAAASLNSPLSIALSEDPEADWVRTLPLGLAGEYQFLNAMIVVRTVEVLAGLLPVESSVLRSGLQETQWPGRFERVVRGSQTLVLDGAHNRPAFQALVDAMTRAFPARRYALLLGMLADKDGESAAELLVPGAVRTVVVPLHTSRAGDPAELARLCSKAAGGRRVERAADVRQGFQLLAGEDLVLITGSLYLVGEAMDEISGAANSERELNDWSPTR